MLGKKFGMLTVLYELMPYEKKSWQKAYKVYKCRCDCGAYTTATGVELRAGNKRSCGCMKGRKQPPSHPAEVQYLQGFIRTILGREISASKLEMLMAQYAMLSDLDHALSVGVIDP